jgi:hypothetical protein
MRHARTHPRRRPQLSVANQQLLASLMPVPVPMPRRATKARRPSGLAMVTARRQDTPGSAVHCPRVMCCGTTSK